MTNQCEILMSIHKYSLIGTSLGKNIPVRLVNTRYGFVFGQIKNC